MSNWNPSGTYSYLWFKEYTLPIWQKLLLPHLGKIESYLEIGVAEGLSMRWVLEHLSPAIAEGVDPYWPARQFGDHPREAEQRKKRAVDNLSLWSTNQAICQTGEAHFSRGKYGEVGHAEAILWFASSKEFLSSAVAVKSRPYDLIYVDGNHNASDALLDVVLCWELLKVGGVMVVDDCDQRYRGNRPRAWHAAIAFETCFDTLYDPLFFTNRQRAYRKIERRKKGSPPVLTYAPPIEPVKLT